MRADKQSKLCKTCKNCKHKYTCGLINYVDNYTIDYPCSLQYPIKQIHKQNNQTLNKEGL